MKIHIGFSPCPNDTFIFDALVHKKINTRGFTFIPFLEDVETLNEWALQSKLAVTKLSFPAFFRSRDQYHLLQAGSALGQGVGPLLVSKEAPPTDGEFSLHNKKIAIPGKYTTAHLLLKFAFPEHLHTVPMLFSKIEDALLSAEVDLGLLIHENRFTYAKKGLHKWMDMGDNWEKKMNLPIPLGGIAIRKDLGYETAIQINELIRESLQYAWRHADVLPSFVTENAQEMDEDVMRKHIQLYVNTYSEHLGDSGKKAIEALFQTFCLVEGIDNNSITHSSLFI